MSLSPRRWLPRIRRLLEPGKPEQSDSALLERFARNRDESAFATLVERHAGLVLGVCRRVLGNLTLAEDCAQATFVVLALKAGGIRRPDGLAGWLYGTAYRLASRQRRGEQRRRRREESFAQTVKPPAGDLLDGFTARELVATLDEELQRLPEAYRLPLILCALEGLSQEEAAARLGWSAGSVRGRLERGRALLKARLQKRGLSLSVVLGAAALPASPVPGELAGAMVRSAVEYAAGHSAHLSPVVLAFVKEELRLMSTWKIKAALAFVVMTGAFGAGVGWLMNASHPGDQPGQARTQAAAPAEKPAAQKEKSDPRADRIAKTKDEMGKIDRKWEDEDEELSAQIVGAKVDQDDLEDQLRALKSEKLQAEVDAERTRVVRAEAELRKLMALYQGKNAKITAAEGDVKEAKARLLDALKKAEAATQARSKLRRQSLMVEETLRRLEVKRADRREQFVRRRDDLADRIRHLESADVNEPNDRPLRGIERRLDVIQRELTEVKRELRKMQESGKKQR